MRSRRYYIVRGTVRFFFYLAVLLTVLFMAAAYKWVVYNYLGI